MLNHSACCLTLLVHIHMAAVLWCVAVPYLIRIACTLIAAIAVHVSIATTITATAADVCHFKHLFIKWQLLGSITPLETPFQALEPVTCSTCVPPPLATDVHKNQHSNYHQYCQCMCAGLQAPPKTHP